MHLPQLTGTHIRLRSVGRSDIPALVKGANDRTIARFMPSIAYPYTEDYARRRVNCVQRSARRDAAYQFGIERLDRPGVIGMMGLKNLNLADRSAELEYWLARSCRGKGYASEALRLLLAFAFGELHLHRVYAVILASNELSMKLAERHGMMREGTWREGCRAGNAWLDVYAHGLLASEFRSRSGQGET